jgi:hypothetical protein
MKAILIGSCYEHMAIGKNSGDGFNHPLSEGFSVSIGYRTSFDSKASLICLFLSESNRDGCPVCLANRRMPDGQVIIMAEQPRRGFAKFTHL